MIIDILKKTKTEKSLIGIRINEEDWDEVLIGFIYSINTTNVVMNEIDENGNSTGYTTISINKILRIDLDDRYQKRLKFIFDNRKKIIADNQITISNDTKALLNNINILIKNKQICTLYFDEDQYITGILQKKDSKFILVKNIGRQGDDEGFSYYELNRIIGLKYDGIDERKISLLYKNWKVFYQKIS